MPVGTGADGIVRRPAGLPVSGTRTHAHRWRRDPGWPRSGFSPRRTRGPWPWWRRGADIRRSHGLLRCSRRTWGSIWSLRAILCSCARTLLPDRTQVKSIDHKLPLGKRPHQPHGKWPLAYQRAMPVKKPGGQTSAYSASMQAPMISFRTLILNISGRARSRMTAAVLPFTSGTITLLTSSTVSFQSCNLSVACRAMHSLYWFTGFQGANLPFK